MITLADLTAIIANYNADYAGPVTIDPALANPIIQILTTRPPDVGAGVKVLKPAPPAPPAPSPAPADRGNTAYVFRDSLGQRYVLIKGNTQVSRGVAAQPGQIGSGSTKVVKKYGGILLELNAALDVTSNQCVITFSSIAELLIMQKSLETHTKYAILHRIIQDKPSDFLYTFRSLQFDDPTTHEKRLILFAPRAGRDFQDVRRAWVRFIPPFRPAPQQRMQAAFTYLQGLESVLRKSLWPVDLKPENTGYEEVVSGEPTLTPYDFLGDGATFTIFKNQFQQMMPLLAALFNRPAIIAPPLAHPPLPPLAPRPYTDQLFNAVIKQLIFEIAHMMFLIFNPAVQYVREAAYDTYFGGSGIHIRIIGGGVEVCPNTAYLYNFFTSYCHNGNYTALTPPPPSFRHFLIRLRTEFGTLGAIPSQFTDEWINGFDQLVHNFRTSPAPMIHPVENLTMTV